MHAYLSLSECRRWEGLAASLGVSEVARGPQGFLAQYKRAGGRPERLSAHWRARREAFIARHMAQVEANDEALFHDGKPSRRHLALIMWAYSPFAARLRGARAQNPVTALSVMRTPGDVEPLEMDLDGLPSVWLRRAPIPEDGIAPLRSYNARDGQYEEGLSVYKAWAADGTYYIDARGLDIVSTMFIAFNDRLPLAEVRCAGGITIVGQGGDGEPLLEADNPHEPLYYELVEGDVALVLDAPMGRVQRKANPEGGGLGARFTAIVREHQVERIQELINAVALRFDREGLPRPTVRWGASRKDGRVGWVRDLHIDDPLPRLPGGWFIIAAIDHIEGGNIIHARTNESLQEYRDAPARCEHCNTTRRRKRTFVLENEKGERVQVGADCLEAFTGRPDILRIVAGFDLLLALERDILGLGDESEGGGGRPSEFNTLRVATIAASVVRTSGWVSRRQAEEQGISATADAVLAVLAGKVTSQATPDDEARARAAIQWAQHLSDADVAESKSDYLHNIRVLARNDYVHWRHIATVCSIVPAYDRWRAQGQHIDEWAGEIGATVSWGVPPEVTKKGAPKPGTWTEVGAWVVIEGTTSLPGLYGEKTLVRFRDDKGRSLVWFATGRKVGLPVGERVGLIGTVKKHEVYQGKKQTTLTRAVIRELRKANPRASVAVPLDGPRMFTEAEVASRMAALRAAWSKCPPTGGLPVSERLRRIETSFRTLPWEDDPSGQEQAEFLAYYAEQVDPERCAKARAKARARAREERREREWERQGVDVSDISREGRVALDRKLRGKTVWLYHGTSSKMLPKILKDGLSFDPKRKFPETTEGVYLSAVIGDSTTLSGAAGYARRAASRFGGDPVVLRVLIDYDDLEWDSDDEDIATGQYQWKTAYVPASAIKEVNGEHVK